MKTQQQMVREFHENCGATIGDKPGSLTTSDIQLRMSLMEEELGEFWIAAKDEDLVGMADALGDLLYVVLGTAVSAGIDMEPIFNEIHRSNMTKFIDGKRRDDGKWMKGPSYAPPDLAPILREQGGAL